MLLIENFQNGLCKFYGQIITNDCTSNFYGLKGGNPKRWIGYKIKLVYDTAYIFDI